MGLGYFFAALVLTRKQQKAMAKLSASHKRKYDDEEDTPPRPTGFSDARPPGPYANVPEDSELAKQKIQHHTSLAFNAKAKHSRLDNANALSDHKPLASKSQLGSTKRIKLPNTYVDVFIGKTEDAIKYIEMESGARIQLTSDADHNSNMPNRTVELMGNLDQIAKAEDLINWILKARESNDEVCNWTLVISKIQRKLSAGPAIGEELTLPYDMKCKGCTSVIAAGVKFADYEREEVKSSIFSGRVRRFTVKCPCCPNEIVIETCHFNPWYVILQGAERTPKPERKQASGVSNSNIKRVPPAWPNARKIIYHVAKEHRAA